MSIPEEFVAALIAAGYRRTSNKYGHVSRIDRPDWLRVLAEHLGRSEAQFFAPRAAEPEANWKDYYRRVLSKDGLDLGPVLGRSIPTSSWDSCGYIDVPADTLASLKEQT
jgi:hypothetical protein